MAFVDLYQRLLQPTAIGIRPEISVPCVAGGVIHLRSHVAVNIFDVGPRLALALAFWNCLAVNLVDLDRRLSHQTHHSTTLVPRG